MDIALLVGTFLVSAIFCHFIAKGRRADAVFWGVMGAVFGPLAIPFAFFARPSSRG
ncbi:MAG: hypothetical protein PVF34_00620 [Gammaproteobacteria bacterium]